MKLEILKDGTKIVNGDSFEIAKLLKEMTGISTEVRQVEKIKTKKKKAVGNWTTDETKYILDKDYLSVAELSRDSFLRKSHTRMAILKMANDIRRGNIKQLKKENKAIVENHLLIKDFNPYKVQ